MKPSSAVLWAVVGVLVAVAVAVSCANGAEPPCDQVQCSHRCIGAGHARGTCDQGACICGDGPGADADADVPDAPDTPPDVDARTDDTARPDDARVDDSGPVETTEGGEAKSAACDPLLCFLACGGTCSIGGECVCPPAAP